MEVLLLPWSSSSKILVSNFSLAAFRGPLPSVPAFLLLSELFLYLLLSLWRAGPCFSMVGGE